MDKKKKMYLYIILIIVLIIFARWAVAMMGNIIK